MDEMICLNCKAHIDKPVIIRDSHGLPGPYYETIYCCPVCGWDELEPLKEWEEEHAEAEWDDADAEGGD